MKKAQKVLIKLLARELFGKMYKIEQLSAAQWNEVFNEAQQQAVLRIACNAATKLSVPDGVRSKWQIAALNNLRNNIIIENNHIQLHNWLESAGIPYVVLKGCSSAYYYPSPIDRAMGDVDFLVKKSDLERAGEILKANGLKPWEVDHICHIVYRKPKMHLEMHFDLSGVPHGKPGELVHKYIEDIFEKSFISNTVNGSMCLPSKFHHGLIILLHTSHHLTGEGIGLRHLCDWAVFLDSCSNEEFKALFENKFKAIGMWKFASVLSAICIKYLGCKTKSCLMDIDAELSKQLVEDILFGGNFGKKDSQSRQLQARMISDRGKSGINQRSLFGNFIYSVNESVKNHWPKARNHPVIIPIGWIYFGTLKLSKRLGKTSSTNIRNTLSNASKRKDLYSQLGIFEMEN